MDPFPGHADPGVLRVKDVGPFNILIKSQLLFSCVSLSDKKMERLNNILCF